MLLAGVVKTVDLWSAQLRLKRIKYWGGSKAEMDSHVGLPGPGRGFVAGVGCNQRCTSLAVPSCL